MDLNGRIFGKLTVKSTDESRKGYVICECECGNTKSIRATSLTKQDAPTCSCGCIHKKSVSMVGRKTIYNNSKEQVDTNIKYNTNIQVISSSTPPKHNTSGHKGLHFRRGGWSVYIQVHRKRKYLGWYKDKEDAIRVRQEAEEKYYKPILEVIKNTTKES